MKINIIITALFCCFSFFLNAQQLDSMDALIAAPKNHRILFENDSVRILEVTLLPGEKEPFHHHQRPSIFIVTSPARI
jgi:quercetin dioxygenase-like cupin family protein